MIASLYQSGSRSSCWLRRNSRHLCRSYAPDRYRRIGAQPHVLHLPVPDKTAAAEQIVCHQRARIRQAPFPQWYLEIGLFGVMRIEADRNQNPLCALARISTEIQNVIVERVVESGSEMRLQRRLGTAQPIKGSDFRDDISGFIPIPEFQLVFFGIPVFLAPRKRL